MWNYVPNKWNGRENKIRLCSLSVVGCFVVVVRVDNIVGVVGLAVELVDVVVSFVVAIVVVPQNKYLRIISCHQKELVSISFVDE